MRLTTLSRLLPVLILTLVLAACDEEQSADGSDRSPLPTPADNPGKDVPGAKDLLGGKQLAEKRLPSGRRLAEVLVANAAGMTRHQEPEVKKNDSLRRVTAKADYFAGAQYRYDKALEVEVQWFGKAVMGLGKLGFGMYRPTKMKVSGFDAVAKHPVPEENDKDSAVRVLVAPQLIVHIETANHDVAGIVTLLEALDLASLRAQVDDGSIFTPSPDEVTQAGLMKKDGVKALLPAEIRGLPAENHNTRDNDDSFGFNAMAGATYRILGSVKLTDAGAADRAKKRWPIEGIDTDGVKRHEKQGQEVTRDRISAAGTEAFVIRIGAPGKLDQQATVLWRAHAGRFVLEGQFAWMQPQKGMSDEAKKKMGFGLFPDALAQVKGVLEGLDVPGLSKR